MSWEFKQKTSLFTGDYTKVEKWRFITHQDEEKESEILIYPDAVFVFGLTEDRKVLRLKQYSLATRDYINHLVAGYVETGEKPIDSAKREFKEETGYKANEWKKLGYSHRSKWATGNYHFYFATDLEQVEEPTPEGSEDIEVKLTSLEKFKQILFDSNLHAVASVACAYKALAYLDEI